MIYYYVLKLKTNNLLKTHLDQIKLANLRSIITVHRQRLQL